MENLITALTISLITIAVHVLSWRDMLFGPVAIWIEKKVPAGKHWLLKPLYMCLICMSSVYSVLYWLFMGCSFNLLIVMLCTCGINTIITSVIANILPDE